jgi:hypothetical protein
MRVVAGNVGTNQGEKSDSLRRAIAAARGELPQPRVVDVLATVADLYPAFDDTSLRNSYQGDWLSLTLGILRANERFPPSNRWHTGPLIEWERRTRAMLRADDAFDILTSRNFAPLMPHAALSVTSFGGTVFAAIKEISRRLQVDRQRSACHASASRRRNGTCPLASCCAWCETIRLHAARFACSATPALVGPAQTL